MMMISSIANAGAIVLEGLFQGKDIYVQNPEGPKGVGYAVYEVQVNGEITADEINSSAFVIDLNVMNFMVGDPITVKIIHHDGTSPKVLNKEAILPTSTFDITKLEVTKDATVIWETNNESGSLTYVVEQYRWNKWIKLGEVIGTGNADRNTYSFSFDSHAGTNTLRVKQRDHSGKPRYSDEVTYDAIGVSQVEFTPKKVDHTINFTRETRFEIFNEYGELKKRGFDAVVDVEGLDKGTYYINYDNRFGETFVLR